MIGVAVSPDDLDAVEEFFELFKTPWELVKPGRSYEVVVAAGGHGQDVDTGLLLLYGPGETTLDREAGIGVAQKSGLTHISWQASTFSVSTGTATFDTEVGASVLVVEGERAVDYRHSSGAKTVRRIGYDLFREVKHLLTVGQPASEALTPTLELHIALVRHFLTEHKIPFVEIPPRPAGYDFTCCLTHDVDFWGIRRHRFDRTLAGFLARASVGTLIDAIRGRRSLSDVARNWWTLVSLPLVFLGVVRDPWSPFEDYATVEADRRSTFFLIPHAGRPGLAPDGSVDPRRAVPYEISQVGDQARRALADGSELGVHGIDGWRDTAAGAEELKQLTSVTGQKTAGTRMHWLYFDEESAGHLEGAGYAYDSTWGYNEAVGYRAGTSQVFRLLLSRRLLELPFSIMDSALFYSGRMGLSRDEGISVCCRVVEQARRFGGTLVINWHGRSLAPERLWGAVYVELLREIEKRGRAWYATADEAVRWFRWRRSIRFSEERGVSGRAVTISAGERGSPAATVSTYGAHGASGPAAGALVFDGTHNLRVGVQA